MHGVDGVLLHDGKQFALVKVGVFGVAASQAEGTVSLLHMQRISIRFGVNRNRVDTHCLQRSYHPYRNGASIGNQNFLQHIRSMAGRPAVSN